MLSENYRYVVKGSQDAIVSKMNGNIDVSCELATIGIDNLYPSIAIEHLIQVVCTKIKMRHPNAYGTFAATMVKLLLRNQTIFFESQAHVSRGLATGIPPAVLLANVYLSECDAAIVSQVWTTH